MIIVNMKNAQISLTNAEIMGGTDIDAFVIPVYMNSPIQMELVVVQVGVSSNNKVIRYDKLKRSNLKVKKIVTLI